MFLVSCTVFIHALKPSPNGRNIVGCYLLRPFAHPVACCLCVVWSCCTKFETGPTSIRVVLPVASPAYVLLVRQAGTRDQPLLGTSALEAMLPVTIMFLCL